MVRDSNGLVIYTSREVAIVLGVGHKIIKLNDESLSQEDWERDYEKNNRWKQLVCTGTGDGVRYLRGIVKQENWNWVGDFPGKPTIHHYEWWGGFSGEWVEDRRRATYFPGVPYMLALLERAGVKGARHIF